ncbi:MAG: zinc ribbon domain-containing protein [Desulfobacterales bacterium]|nr:zinc ribbon domain-containing protein [Desulfobacterales bacterium]
MPIYEYQCQNCNKIEEAFQSINDEALSKCPSCSGKLSKLISQSSFHLKGSGWYVTDYAQKTNNANSVGSSTTSNESKSGDNPSPKVETSSDKSN